MRRAASNRAHHPFRKSRPRRPPPPSPPPCPPAPPGAGRSGEVLGGLLVVGLQLEHLAVHRGGARLQAPSRRRSLPGAPTGLRVLRVVVHGSRRAAAPPRSSPTSGSWSIAAASSSRRGGATFPFISSTARLEELDGVVVGLISLLETSRPALRPPPSSASFLPRPRSLASGPRPQGRSWVRGAGSAHRRRVALGSAPLTAEPFLVVGAEPGGLQGLVGLAQADEHGFELVHEVGQSSRWWASGWKRLASRKYASLTCCSVALRSMPSTSKYVLVLRPP